MRTMKMEFLFGIVISLVCFEQYTDAQICFNTFRPANTYGGRGGHCAYPIGGVGSGPGVFIPSFDMCCRRPGAGGWGLQYSCEPCRTIRGTLSSWSAWSACSRSCGLGVQTRRRICSTGVCVGITGSNLQQQRPCSWRRCCPVDGGWTSWSKSTGCSVTCGQGYEYRIRSCSAPKKKCGGKQCVGIGKQFKECFINCANWAEWITQVPCSASCGNGTLFRQRVCERPFGGFCPGPSEENLPCNAGRCPANGNWCKWMQWTQCSSTCEEFSGIRKRVRICACPFPEDGGKQCEDSDRNTDQCNGNVVCSVNGGWSDWTTWSSCSATPCSVEHGIRNRTRLCNNPAPLLYGKNCQGENFEEQSCMNMSFCKVEGRYESWSDWSACTASCGKCGVRRRTRGCVSPFQDPLTWGVQAVTGVPDLLCFDKRMKHEKKCKLDPCPDGVVDPCKSSTDQPKDDDEEEGSMDGSSN